VTSAAQLRENIEAWKVELTDEVTAAIDAIHLRYTNPAP
jgi:aryl-alcohol dehydrogenase-like predicted oxidoreductase